MVVCPVGFFCFDKNTVILVIMACIVMVSHFIGKNNDRFKYVEDQLYKNVDKINSANIKMRNLMIDDNRSRLDYKHNLYHDRIHNKLKPPERSHSIQVPINIPTRGVPTGFQQVGVLIQSDGIGNNQVKLPLYGEQLYPGSNDWRYYTSSDGYQSVKLALIHDNKNTMEQHGCREIYNGTEVDVTGYDSRFKATIYKLDTPRYLPHVI